MKQISLKKNTPPLPTKAQKQQILILDFDSQYSQLIARRIREMGVYCEVKPPTMSKQEIIDFAPKGIVLSGGPQSVTDKYATPVPEIVFSLNIPVLGICYGMQIMAQQLGGIITCAQEAEFGHTTITFEKKSSLFQSLADLSELNVWMSHNDSVIQLPVGFRCIASSKRCSYAAIEDPQRHYYGIQFHAEVTNTQYGAQLLNHFVLNICKVEPHWQPHNIIEERITYIQQQVGNQQVILAVSGGVDSSVVAALLHRALGKQLHCIFVDTGLLRLDEQRAIETLQKQLEIQVTCLDASEQFLHALDGVTDPEQKRKIIGHKFIAVFQKHAQQIPHATWLAQGTIYPDIIESASDNKTIKSHHNVGGLPKQMNLKLLEPIKTLFKDEVRKLGLTLGLPHHVIYRHPFPGPGLAVRILGAIQRPSIEILRKADAIFIEELRAYNLYDDIAQAFAIFLPVQSVGVKGDVRHYGPVIALRAVTSTDFMTADWADLPRSFLAHVANRIVNEIPAISRVVYDITSKPPATIEWE